MKQDRPRSLPHGSKIHMSNQWRDELVGEGEKEGRIETGRMKGKKKGGKEGGEEKSIAVPFARAGIRSAGHLILRHLISSHIITKPLPHQSV